MHNLEEGKEEKKREKKERNYEDINITVSFSVLRCLHTQRDTTLTPGVEDFYFREQIQTVIKPHFYPRLSVFNKNYTSH